MKESFWGIFIVSLGIIGIGVLNILQNVTTTNENNYYSLREVTESAMFDAVDLGYYRRTGQLKIVEQKFVENFMRRFSSTYGRTNTYTVGIYDIIEMPPKVSLIVEVGEGLKVYNYEAIDFDVANRIDGILETKYPTSNTEGPSIPGVFISPTSSTKFQNGNNLTIEWGPTPSWGNPSTGSNYRLEEKCGSNGWVLTMNTGSTTVSEKVYCSSNSLQYRVRAESGGGISDWRYSVIINPVPPTILVPPVTFAYTGSVQQFKAPEAGRYKLEAWGAQGGFGYSSWFTVASTGGGYGAYSTGIITLNQNQVIYVYVGGSSGQSATGGYNGGASASISYSHWGASTYGGGGGGATDFRTISGAWNNASSLNSRVLVAGGGGGSTGSTDPYYGRGNSNSTYIYGTPTYPDGYQGSQSYYDNAGRPSNYSDSSFYLLGRVGQAGTLGIGGAGGTNDYVLYNNYIYGIYGSGGGGGYYGGGGGAGGSISPSLHSFYYGGSGGGGSSYTGSLQSPMSITGGSTMPKVPGGTETGHGGNGNAKITYLGS